MSKLKSDNTHSSQDQMRQNGTERNTVLTDSEAQMPSIHQMSQEGKQPKGAKYGLVT